MRIPTLVMAFLMTAPALHAQGVDAGFASFRLGGLQGGEDIDALRAATEMFWDRGAIDLQLGATVASVGEDDNQNDLRLILSHAPTDRLRLGLSAAWVPDDMIGSDLWVYGLHALYVTSSLSLEGAFLIPDHINSSGAFSFDITGEQWLTDDLSVTTHLFRLSSDPENPDMYSIGLGATYGLTDSITLIGEGFQTRADDYHFNNNGGRIGITYEMASGLSVTAKLIHVIPEDGDTSSGLSIMAEYAFGNRNEGPALFRAQPLPDRFDLVAF